AQEQHQEIPLERKWAKPKSKEETFILPNKVDDPKGYKQAVKKNRHRLRVEFFGREGFDFFLKHDSILRTLQNTSYSEQGLDKTIVVHLYYTTDKRGRIFDFLGEKWDPYIREVTVDNGPINKTADLRDKLCVAITKLQPPSKVTNKEEEEEQQQSEKGETLENEMEVEIQPEPVGESKSQSQSRDTDTELRRLNTKEQRELHKGMGKIAEPEPEAEAEIMSEDSDSNTTKRDSKELKKLKKEQKILQKKMGIFETALRQIANLTNKMITRASSNGEAPQDVALMRQEFNAIFQTLKQQDTDRALPEFTFDFFLKPEELASEVDINPHQQATVNNINTNQEEEEEDHKDGDIHFKKEAKSEKGEENVSSSCLHTSDDEVKPVANPLPLPLHLPRESGIIEAQPQHQQNETKQLLSNKRNKRKLLEQKEPWSQMTKGVLTIWQAIKLIIQRGESEEKLRQNKNTAGSWKPVLDPDYEHRQIFLAFLASDCTIDLNE
ncbi:MAG: hypothetical protein ACQUHE_08390, partial [Bacteroidia bacterium]